MLRPQEPPGSTPETQQFTPIVRAMPLYDPVARQLETVVRRDAFRPGNLLLPANTLADQFGVSSTVGREALRLVAAKGLLQAGPHGRLATASYHNTLAAFFLPRIIRSADVSAASMGRCEVRCRLEGEVAALAVERYADDLVHLACLLIGVAQCRTPHAALRCRTPISIPPSPEQHTIRRCPFC